MLREARTGLASTLRDVVSRAVAQEIAAENELEVRQRALQAILGKEAPPLAPIRPNAEITPPQPADIKQWAGAAEKDNINVQIQMAAVEIASREVERQRAGHYPTVDLVANLGKSTAFASTVGGQLETDFQNVGVQINLPIFQGGLVNSRTNEASANRAAAESTLEQTRRNAALQARQHYLGAVNGLAQVKALKAALVSSQSSLESNRLGFEVGVRINIDVLNADNQVFVTRRDLARAVLDTLMSHFRLKAAVGTLSEDDILAVVAELCEVPSESLYVKLRQRQRGPRQYEKLDSARHEFVVREGGHRFLVNLSDYLDTGLFLDHRETRALVGRMARGKRVLNLFAYTGSFSVYAAAGGAQSTVTMDLSATYLDWAGRNFALNGMDPRQHVRVRAEALSYLRAPRTVPAAAGPFDLIVLDPPTFSNSKKMAGTLDVLRDHPLLIADSLRLLAPGGALLFSCNHHRFTLRADEIPGAHFQDLSAQTLPRDFHDPRTHRCFLVTHGEPDRRSLPLPVRHPPVPT